MASAPFDRFGQNGAHGVFSRVNLDKLAVKRGLKGGTLKQSLIIYGLGITRPGVLYKPMVHIYPSSKRFSRYENRTQFDYKSFSLRAQVHNRKPWDVWCL